MGHELFLDKSTLNSTFIATDVTGPEAAEAFKSIDHTIDIVWAASFFHLFNWDRQVEAAKRVAGLLKTKNGSVILGRQLGSVKPGAYDIMADGRWCVSVILFSLSEFSTPCPLATYLVSNTIQWGTY